MIVRICLVGLLVACADPLGAGARLSMHVTPSVSFAPANLTVRTQVEANSENRAMLVIAESDAFYRSSEIELDGDRAPRVTLLNFRSLPSGIYRVRAVLKGQGGHEIAYAQSHVNVVESGYIGGR